MSKRTPFPYAGRSAIDGGGATPAPTGLVAFGLNGQALLAWDAQAGVTFNLYRGTTPGGESGTAVATGLTGTSHTDPALSANQYYWTLKAVSGSGISDPSNEATSIVIPTGVQASLFIAYQRYAGLLWQDAGKTVPAVANNDPVRVATCPFTAVDFTATSAGTRPLLTDTGSGTWGLTFDGVDDFLTLGLASGIFDSTTSDNWSVLTAVNPASFSGGRSFIQARDTNTGRYGSVGIHFDGITSHVMYSEFSGTPNLVGSTNLVAATAYVLDWENSSADFTEFVNGNSDSTGAQGTGGATSSTDLYIGGRQYPGNLDPFSGVIYGLINYSPRLSSGNAIIVRNALRLIHP